MKTRIEPTFDADGEVVAPNPPCGGYWLRDADGGLTPADATTAAAAGLKWPTKADPIDIFSE
jgi:hypothetical protein